MNVKTKDNKKPKQEFILSSNASITINKTQFSSPYFNVKLNKKVNGKDTSDDFEFNLHEGEKVDSYKTMDGTLSIKGLNFDKKFKLTETKKSGYEDLKDIKFDSKSQQNGVFLINQVEGFNKRVKFIDLEDKDGNKKELKETDDGILISNKDTLILEVSNEKTSSGGGGGGGGGTPETENATAVLANGKKYTDVLTATVLANERNCPILLTDTELRLLEFLYNNKGNVMSIKDIYEAVWEEKYLPNSNNTVMVFMLGLRKKIEEDYANPKHIITIWGKGYKYV